MADFKPDEKLEAEEFEQITRSRSSNLYHNPFLRIITAIIIVVLLVLLARFIHHEWKLHHSPKPVRPTFSNPASSTNSNSSSTSGSSSSNSANSGQSATSTSQMPNTGPGDVVAVFLAASFAAYLLHLTVASRRTN